MRYKYQSYITENDPDGLILYPLVNVDLRRGRKVVNIDCLIDSGASESLFSLDLAVILGVDLARAPRQEYVGISTETVHGFKADIDLRLKGFKNWITLNVGFADLNEMPLLGHSGFFENFEINFQADRGLFTIVSN